MSSMKLKTIHSLIYKYNREEQNDIEVNLNVRILYTQFLFFRKMSWSEAGLAYTFSKSDYLAM